MKWRIGGVLVLVALLVGSYQGWRFRTDPPALLLGNAMRALRSSAPSNPPSITVETWDTHLFTPAPSDMHIVSRSSGTRARQDQSWAGVRQTICDSPAGGWVSSDGVVTSLPKTLGATYDALLCWPELLKAGSRNPKAYARSAGWRRLPDGTWAEGVQISLPGVAPITVDFDGKQALPVAVEVMEPNYSRGKPDAVINCIFWQKTPERSFSPGRTKTYRNGTLASFSQRSAQERIEPYSPAWFKRPPTVTGIGSAEVPLEITYGLPFVRVSLNGSRPLRFMIDTGCGITALTQLAWKAAGVQSTGTMGTTHWLSPMEAALGRLKTAQIGGAVARNVAVGLGIPGSENLYGEDFGGLLGFNVLARFQVTLDYPGRELVLEPVSSPGPAGSSVPILVNGGWPYVAATLFGHRATLLLDTGTRRTFVREEDVRRSPWSFFQIRRRAGYTLGPGGKKLDEIQWIAPELQVGNLTQRKFPVYTIQGGPERTGILGSSFLQNYRVTLNYQRQQLTLE